MTLTAAEKELASKARSGEEADCTLFGTNSDKEVNPQFLRALILGLLDEKDGGVRLPGAVRLKGATITGPLDLSWCGTLATPLPGLILQKCEIVGNLILTSASLGEVRLEECKLREFIAAGAHVDGELRLNSLELTGAQDGQTQIDLDDAVVAHCVRITNCSAKLENAPEAKNCAIGAIKFKNASIGGDLELRDLRIQPSIGNEDATPAIDANYITIAGAVTLESIETVGGASFLHAKIGGRVHIIGSMFEHTEGLAFNLGWSSVGSLVFSAAINFSASPKPVSISGIFFGFGLIAPGGVVMQTKSRELPRCLELDGVLDFRNLKAGIFQITEASLRPIDKNCEAAQQHSHYINNIILLSHAEIVGTLMIRFDDTSDARGGEVHSCVCSHGIVDLRGAQVGTLDDDSGRGWGQYPLTAKSPSEIALCGVVLELDGFIYERLKIDHTKRSGEAPINSLSGLPKRGQIDIPRRRRKIRRWFLDLSADDWSLIEHRLAFIDRMHGSRESPNTFYPQPYRELAQTLRDMGHSYAARPIFFAMERESLKGAPRGKIGKIFWMLYHLAFGFGYSSLHAVRTLVILCGLGWAFFWVAENYDEHLGELLHFGQVLHERPISTLENNASAHNPIVFISSKSTAIEFCGAGMLEGHPLSYPCLDPHGRVIEKPPHAVALRRIFATEKNPHDWAPPCEALPWLYMIDVMVPILDLKVESTCGFRHEAPWYWHFLRTLGAVVGAIVIPLAALTFSGLLRRE